MLLIGDFLLSFTSMMFSIHFVMSSDIVDGCAIVDVTQRSALPRYRLRLDPALRASRLRTQR